MATARRPLMFTARQRGEPPVSCAFCLDPCEVSERQPILTCSRCNAIVHEACWSAYVSANLGASMLAARQDGFDSMEGIRRLHRCISCRACVHSLPNVGEARLIRTPPRRKLSLRAQIKELQRSVRQKEELLSTIRARRSRVSAEACAAPADCPLRSMREEEQEVLGELAVTLAKCADDKRARLTELTALLSSGANDSVPSKKRKGRD